MDMARASLPAQMNAAIGRSEDISALTNLLCRDDVRKYVPLRETIRGVREIIEGKHDMACEESFYMVGSIDVGSIDDVAQQ